jgi:2-polyprenyl-3-methyl-5-hydroxy-6-metoxy-1,4-benzoquinol methylase
LQKFDWYYLADKYEYTFARDFIKSSDSVLEIGCGKGVFAQKISAKTYLGLEFNQKAIDNAVGDGLLVLKESIQTHAAANPRKYDVVCAFQVLEHVAEINSFISSSLACLKVGGLLIYSVPSADTFLTLVTNYILNMPPHHISWWSDQCLTNVADIFNLNVLAIRHEKLATLHRRWYASTIVLASFRNWLNLKYTVLDRSLRYEILNAAALLIGSLLSRGLVDSRLLPDGASVTVVYQKQER